MTRFDTQARELGETVAAYGHGYLLIDPYLTEPQEPLLAALSEADVTTVPVNHPALTPDQRPRLIRLRPANVERIQASLMASHREQSDPENEASTGFAIGGWLFTPASAERVAYHLARVMQPRAPGESRARYMRWADPRVLAWLWPALDTRQHVQLLGPIDAWWTLTRTGEWAIYTATDDDAPSHRRTGDLKLTPAQWATAARGENIHALVRAWQHITEALPADYLARAARLLEQGDALGLNRADSQLLALCCLQVHPRLMAHPRISACIEQARASDIALADALASIENPDGWERIQAELDDPNFRRAPQPVAS